MARFPAGGLGHGKHIIDYVRDLEGKTGDPNANLWGPLGPVIREMEWEDLVFYFEEMDFPDAVIDEQRRVQWNGRDLQDIIDTLSDSEAIQRTMKLFMMERKHAVRCINNVKARARKAAPEPEEGLQLSPLKTMNQMISVMEHMNDQGFGRYHGTEVFAAKLAGNRGVDAILKLIDESDDDVCLSGLRALLMISDSSEERPTEASSSEAQRRFDKRKLIVKANGTHVLLQVLGPGEREDGFARPPECQELALRLLTSVSVFPAHWIGWSGDDMTLFYRNSSTALISYGFPVLINVILQSPSHKVQALGITLIGSLMFDDDERIKRTSGVLLTSSFYVEPKPRRRMFKGQATPGSSRASTAASAASFGSSAMGSLETPKEPIGPRRQAVVDSGALTALAALAGGGVRDVEEHEMDALEHGVGLSRSLDLGATGEGGWKKCPGRVILKHIMAKGLPKADRMGDSDPFLRVFVEYQEQRTEVIDNCSSPQWRETMRFSVVDMATARIAIMVFDSNDNAPDKFMCMCWINLADVVAGAVEDGSNAEAPNLSQTELLAKLQRRERNLSYRAGSSIRLDDWLELCERSGKQPNLTGSLGSIHINLEIQTGYRHDENKLEIQAHSLEPIHILLSSAAMRDSLRGPPRTPNYPPSTANTHVTAPRSAGGGSIRRESLSTRPSTRASGSSGSPTSNAGREADAGSSWGLHSPRGVLGPVLGQLVHDAVRMIGTNNQRAQCSAAAILADLSLDELSRGAIIASGATDRLLMCLDLGSKEVKLMACYALSLLSLHEDFAERLISPGAHLGAGSDGIRPIVDVLCGLGAESDDVAATALSVLCNACLNSKVCTDRILLSRAPVEVVSRMHIYRCDARAEGSTLLALLSDDLDNRRVVATFSGRVGDRTSTVLDALSTALCTEDSPTDARSEVGALDARAAAASALCHLTRYGGLATLVHAITHGDQEIKTEAASAMAKIADQDEEKDMVVSTGVVDSLLEMIILSSTPRARLMAGRVLAHVSEPGENEHISMAMKRIHKVCAVVPKLGLSCILPTIDILLRSLFENQKAVAAQCLSSWCMDRAYASEVWFHGAEPLIDLLLTDPKVNPDGVYYAVQTIISLGTHEDMRETLATFSFTWEGEVKGVMKAVRQVLRLAARDITCEAAGIFYTLWAYGGLEQLTDVLVNMDAEPSTLKSCAQALQPLCSKAPTRKRIAERAKKDLEQVGVWLSSFIIMDMP